MEFMYLIFTHVQVRDTVGDLGFGCVHVMPFERKIINFVFFLSCFFT